MGMQKIPFKTRNPHNSSPKKAASTVLYTTFFNNSISELELSNIQCESRTRIAVHTVQLLPERSFREKENNEVVTAEPNGNVLLVLNVVVCIMFKLHVYVSYICKCRYTIYPDVYIRVRMKAL